MDISAPSSIPLINCIAKADNAASNHITLYLLSKIVFGINVIFPCTDALIKKIPTTS
jgi:hypothetical protein